MTRTITINVGLAASAHTPLWSTQTVAGRELAAMCWALRHMPGAVLVERRLGTEPTLVLHGEAPAGTMMDIHRLCGELARECEQDCVAYQVQRPGVIMPGQVSGPRAASWMPFDPSKFLQPTRTLA